MPKEVIRIRGEDRKEIEKAIISADYIWHFKDNKRKTYIRTTPDKKIKLSALAEAMGKNKAGFASHYNKPEGLSSSLAKEILDFLERKHGIKVKLKRAVI